MGCDIQVEVTAGDALAAHADVLALKHAQGFYGVDLKVAGRLLEVRAGQAQPWPAAGGHWLCDSHGTVAARRILFVGVPELHSFRYQQIREFGSRVLAVLGAEVPGTRSVALTLHGVGAGLDEAECFLSELAGLTDAIEAGEYPAGLETVTVIERDERRASRLRQLLDDHIPGHRIPVGSRAYGQAAQVGLAGPAARRKAPAPSAQQDPRSRGQRGAGVPDFGDVGDASERKPHVFVAMPFTDDLDDLFHYGISRAIGEAGFLCERIDASPATGDIVARIRERIETAAFVVAELTGANPNVYLEVGYAWGRDVPTVLLTRESELASLCFDVRGHRCVTYKSIRDLEHKLTNELLTLKAVPRA